MNYYYDILVNMNDDKAIEFYEWMDNDPVEHIKKLPTFRVNSKVVCDVLNYYVTFDEDVLEKVYMKTEVNNKSVKQIEYMFLLTDTKNAVVVECNKRGKVICLSKLSLNDEVNLIEIANAFNEKDVRYKKHEKRVQNQELRIEKEIKDYLLCEIKTLYNSKTCDKLKYIYYEWTNKLEDDISILFKNLKKLILEKFTSKHQYIYDLVRLSYETKNS